MELTLNTPALLFSAISLLMLAYTNRFFAIASLIRNLQIQYKNTGNKKLVVQINSLYRRIRLIRNMQVAGCLSFFCCVLCMFLIFMSQEMIAKYVFSGSLILLMYSLGISIVEINISVNALTIQLSDLEDEKE
ncbi:MAG: DUF2721 domain-containing protein [Bacteroidetes bacterium]|nr:MAG: DUF2721 domain-containing protein [Bacteroidota bacterium]